MIIQNSAGQSQRSMSCARVSDPVAALNEAIKSAGGILAFARAMGLSHQVVYQWKKRGYVPAERALIIEHKYDIPHNRLIRRALAEMIAG